MKRTYQPSKKRRNKHGLENAWVLQWAQFLKGEEKRSEKTRPLTPKKN